MCTIVGRKCVCERGDVSVWGGVSVWAGVSAWGDVDVCVGGFV